MTKIELWSFEKFIDVYVDPDLKTRIDRRLVERIDAHSVMDILKCFPDDSSTEMKELMHLVVHSDMQAAVKYAKAHTMRTNGQYVTAVHDVITPDELEAYFLYTQSLGASSGFFVCFVAFFVFASVNAMCMRGVLTNANDCEGAPSNEYLARVALVGVTICSSLFCVYAVRFVFNNRRVRERLDAKCHVGPVPVFKAPLLQETKKVDDKTTPLIESPEVV